MHGDYGGQRAVITGIARAGIDALIELAGGKAPRGRVYLGMDPARACGSRHATATVTGWAGRPGEAIGDPQLGWYPLEAGKPVSKSVPQAL